MGGQVSRPVDDGTEASLKKFTHFTPSDLKEWSTSFKTSFPANNMQLIDMVNLFHSLYPNGSPNSFCKALFRTINIAQNDKIDFNELLIALSILISGSDFERLRWLFRFYDQDRDGVVSRAELTEGITSICELVKGTPASQIDPECIADEIFRNLQNNSGFLTFDDFDRLSILNKECFARLAPS